MVSVTTTAMAVVKMLWEKCTGMPREEANCGCTDVRVSRLEQSTQNTATPMKTNANAPISVGVMERMSPMRYLLYLVKLPPPSVATKIPKATAVLEKTPIKVENSDNKVVSTIDAEKNFMLIEDFNYEEGGTTIDRNGQIGGHKE